MDQLVESVRTACEYANLHKSKTDDIIARFENYVMEQRGRELCDDRRCSNDVSELNNPQYTAKHQDLFIGFDEITDMSSWCSRNDPSYQIVFEHEPQHLLFEYVGNDVRHLEIELEKLYPGSKIMYSHGDIVIRSSEIFENWDMAFAELQKLKKNLKKIDSNMSQNCRVKSLMPIKGSAMRAIQSQLSPAPYSKIRDKIITNITINVVGGNQYNINGDHNNLHINAPVRTREDIHRTWIEENPVEKDEYSQPYYNRLKKSVGNPMCTKAHAVLLKRLGYVKKKGVKGMIWSME